MDSGKGESSTVQADGPWAHSFSAARTMVSAQRRLGTLRRITSFPIATQTFEVFSWQMYYTAIEEFMFLSQFPKCVVLTSY